MRTIKVPVPVNGSNICTFSSANDLLKCFFITSSTDLIIKSTTSIGVKTIPKRLVVDSKAVLKNLLYREIINFCLSSAHSIPSALILIDSYNG